MNNSIINNFHNLGKKIISKYQQNKFAKKIIRQNDNHEKYLNPAFSAAPLSLTIIILTYDRSDGLNNLLKSILMQNLSDIALEVILVNNFGQKTIKNRINKNTFKALQMISDLKIIDSQNNFKTSIRYAMAILAKHETILFLDDDVEIVNPNYIRSMYHTLMSLNDVDMLSSWCSLWTDCDDNYFSPAGVTFMQPEITALTQCDIAGPGICMFHRKIVMDPIVLNTVTDREIPGASDMCFSLIASLQMGTKSYYFPSSGMLIFHRDHKKNAMHNEERLYKNRHKMYKKLYQDGYVPVVFRQEYSASSNTPVHFVKTTAKSNKKKW